jgi:N-acetylneuraminate synthase
MKNIEFDGLEIGPGRPCAIIAEAGVNHNGSTETALLMVDAAADCGADVIKFQSFNTDALITPAAPKSAYQLKTTARYESQRDMLKRLELGKTAHQRLFERARERGIRFLSSPFDEASADMLESIGVGAFKLASGAITNLPLLEHVARKQRPVILSTGMSGLDEVEDAMRVFRRAGNDRIALLHCVSNYPARPEDCNLRAMRALELAFDAPAGFSDHTMGVETALAAVALGACIIEKHFTLDRSMPGPDHAASVEPDGLRALIAGARIVEAALGDGSKKPVARESENRATGRVSLVARVHIPAGTILSQEHLCCKRPGSGISPMMLDKLVGRRTRTEIGANTLLEWSQLE